MSTKGNLHLYRLVAEFLDGHEPDAYDARCAIWEVAKRCPGFSAEERLSALRSAHSELVVGDHKNLSYGEFLKTSYWAVVREYVLESRGGCCAICPSKKNLNVHHKTYIHHFYEHAHLEDLIVLCRECHAKFHNKLGLPSGR